MFCFLNCVPTSGKPGRLSALCRDAVAVPDVLFALAGVGRAAELGQPWAGHRRRAQRPPPPCAGAAPRQPGGAEPHAPHTPGRARAGPAAVPEAQGNVKQCCPMSAILSRNSVCGQGPFSILFASLLVTS